MLHTACCSWALYCRLQIVLHWGKEEQRQARQRIVLRAALPADRAEEGHQRCSILYARLLSRSLSAVPGEQGCAGKESGLTSAGCGLLPFAAGASAAAGSSPTCEADSSA